MRVWDAMGQIGGDLHSCLDSDDASLGSNKKKSGSQQSGNLVICLVQSGSKIVN